MPVIPLAVASREKIEDVIARQAIEGKITQEQAAKKIAAVRASSIYRAPTIAPSPPPTLPPTEPTPTEVETATVQLEALKTTYEEAPVTYKHERYREYRQFYETQYLPMYQRYQRIYETRREREWSGFAGELREARLTEGEIGYIKVLWYGEGRLAELTPEERTAKITRYLENIGPALDQRAREIEEAGAVMPAHEAYYRATGEPIGAGVIKAFEWAGKGLAELVTGRFLSAPIQTRTPRIEFTPATAPLFWTGQAMGIVMHYPFAKVAVAHTIAPALGAVIKGSAALVSQPLGKLATHLGPSIATKWTAASTATTTKVTALATTTGGKLLIWSPFIGMEAGKTGVMIQTGRPWEEIVTETAREVVVMAGFYKGFQAWGQSFGLTRTKAFVKSKVITPTTTPDAAFKSFLQGARDWSTWHAVQQTKIADATALATRNAAKAAEAAARAVSPPTVTGAKFYTGVSKAGAAEPGGFGWEAASRNLARLMGPRRPYIIYGDASEAASWMWSGAGPGQQLMVPVRLATPTYVYPITVISVQSTLGTKLFQSLFGAAATSTTLIAKQEATQLSDSAQSAVQAQRLRISQLQKQIQRVAQIQMVVSTQAQSQVSMVRSAQASTQALAQALAQAQIQVVAQIQRLAQIQKTTAPPYLLGLEPPKIHAPRRIAGPSVKQLERIWRLGKIEKLMEAPSIKFRMPKFKTPRFVNPFERPRRRRKR